MFEFDISRAHVPLQFRFLQRINTYKIDLNKNRYNFINEEIFYFANFSVALFIEENLYILKSPQIYFKAPLTLTYVYITL